MTEVATQDSSPSITIGIQVQPSGSQGCGPLGFQVPFTVWGHSKNGLEAFWQAVEQDIILKEKACGGGN